MTQIEIKSVIEKMKQEMSTCSEYGKIVLDLAIQEAELSISSEICPNCQKEHNSDEWNGYCSKKCWWGFPVD